MTNDATIKLELTVEEQRLVLRLVALLRQDEFQSIKIMKQGLNKRLRLTREIVEEV